MNDTTLLALDLTELAQARVDAAAAEAARKAYLARIENDPEYIALVDACKKSSDRLQIADETVREKALHNFAEQGKDGLVDGVKIALERKLSYQEGEAIQWAIQHSAELLSLNRRSFEKYALAVADVTPLPCVTITTTPAVKIASNLSDYLTGNSG